MSERVCEVCGKGLREDYSRCTNGRCGECHRLYCTPGGDTSPGHGRGKVATPFARSLLAGLVFLVGCASSSATWTHPAHSRALELARAECMDLTEREVPTPERFRSFTQVTRWRAERVEVFEACMTDKGWELVAADPRDVK